VKKPHSEGPMNMVMEVYRKDSNEPIIIIPNEFKKAE
jgi:hypothetical protein